MEKRVGAATERVASYQAHLEAMRQAYGQARYASWLALWINALLAVAKLVAGLLGNSLALVSDAINSIGDMITTSGVLLGMRISAWPATARHPYGFSRVEAVIGLYLAMTLGGAGVWIAREGVLQLRHPTSSPEWYTLIVAAAVVAIKESLYQYQIRVARRLQSHALRATAWDHRADAIAGTAVLIGIGLSRWGYWWGDGAATLIVAGTIIWAGLSLMRENVSELLDSQADVAFLQEIRDAARSVSGVAAIDRLFVRKAGLEYLVDLHVEVDSNLNVGRGHEIAHEVQQAIQHTLPHIHGILVHVEPHRPERHARQEGQSGSV
jgi:cation diffusion facilitator family transporter